MFGGVLALIDGLAFLIDLLGGSYERVELEFLWMRSGLISVAAAEILSGITVILALFCISNRCDNRSVSNQRKGVRGDCMRRPDFRFWDWHVLPTPPWRISSHCGQHSRL